MKFQREVPSISNMTTSNTAYCGSDLAGVAGTASPFLNTWGTGGGGGGAFNPAEEQRRMYDALLRSQQGLQSYQPPQAASSKDPKSATVETFMGRRLVQVFISDPDEKVPLESCLLYSGEQKMTDLTDNELFFEIDIKSVLDTHNAIRAKIVDKAVKDRTEYLEPTRVSKLKMVVVNVATF